MSNKTLKVLNLTKGFDPVHIVQHSGSHINFESLTFHGGEPHIKLDVSTVRSPDPIRVIITQRINSFNDLGLLLTAVDALRGIGIEEISLFVPYFPAARQDRRMVAGEPLTVKIYADIINSLSLSGITILDPHSDVTPALLNKVHVISNNEYVAEVLRDILPSGADRFNLIVPDAGANKKALKLAEFLTERGYSPRIIKCDKERDVATGKLTGFSVNADVVPPYPCLIVDDICDGGGTFIGLAEELKNKGSDELYLAVSHGIFSHGFKELRKHFRRIYTTDSIASDYGWEQPEKEKGSEIVRIVKLRGITRL